MEFYTKRSGHYLCVLYKFLWIIGVTLALLVAGIFSVSAGTFNNQPNTNQKNNKQDSVIYKGRITDEKGNPMSGVVVKISGTDRTTLTTNKGEFSIYAPVRGILEANFIGYQGQQLTLSGLNPLQLITIKLIPGNNNLGEVNIVSTGYQDISRQKVTGSFEVVTKEQLLHSSDPNLVKRLEGITTGMDFNNTRMRVNSANSGAATLVGQFNNSPISNLTVRGKNSFGSVNGTADENGGGVLVVIDGVPSPYSIENINPNDVESINILKDASAASIWGSRAANGVIVIKTKRSSFGKPLSVSFNTNFNISEKLDPFYQKTMSTSEFIDAQIFQFNAANTSIGAANVIQPQPFYSPVAEILNQQKQGQITSTQASAQLDALRGNDIRNDFNKYLFREALTQSYWLNIEGGDKIIAHRVSAGYDNIRNNTVYSGGERLSLTYNASVKPLKNLVTNVNINFSQRTTKNQAQEDYVNGTVGTPFFLYTRLADDQGGPLKVPYKYRPAFVDLMATTYGNNILDLNYVPLQNMKEGYANTRTRSVNVNLDATYKLSSIFSANILYNYNRSNDEQNILNRQNSFYMRDLISQYTTPANYSDPLLGAQPFLKQIPLGGTYRPSVNTLSNYLLRGQLNANKNWGEKHQLNAFAGFDLSQRSLAMRNDQYYGFNDVTLSNSPLLNYYGFVTPLFYDATGAAYYKIPYNTNSYDFRIRNYSMFSNAAYTYNKLYTISASVRKDFSNDFGQDNNIGATPFYSVGGKWNISGEKFYQMYFLPLFQFRATYGSGGSINSRVNQFQNMNTSLTSLSVNNQQQPYRTSILNLGLDFGFKNNRVSGSLEYYDKHTTDILNTNSIDPSTGTINQANYNKGKLHGWGTDLILNSQNFQSGLFSWTSNLLFSYNRVKINRSPNNVAQTAGLAIVGPSHNEGYDLTQLFAFRWAGLDPATGNPMGYLNGQRVVINDYSSYASVANQSISSARYFGSAVPVYFGSLRNTFRYGAFSVSANILYKLGYYFRRPVSDLVQYNSLFNNNQVQGAEYSQRWQKSGDEATTNVPSMIYPTIQQRDNFYRYAEINVQKADHIRLQEVNLSYTLSKRDWFLKNARLYANITNLGIIWRANKLGLDPDINDYPNPRTYAFGLSANF